MKSRKSKHRTVRRRLGRSERRAAHKEARRRARMIKALVAGPK